LFAFLSCPFTFLAHSDHLLSPPDALIVSGCLLFSFALPARFPGQVPILVPKAENHTYASFVRNSFVLPHQEGIFLGWFARDYTSLRNSWEYQIPKSAFYFVVLQFQL